MIQYSCDLCKRPIDAEDDLRYVVKMEIHAAFNPLDLEMPEADCDQLETIDEIIEQLDDLSSDAIGDDVYQRLQFDLCPECRKEVSWPTRWGAGPPRKFNFSQN